MEEIKFFGFESVKPVLIEVAKFFEKAGILYGLNTGTAAYFYGSSRDLDDIDILTTKNGVDAFAKKFSGKPFKKEEGMFHDYLVKTAINGVDVDVVSDLIIVKDDKKYPFNFDSEMIKNRRKIKIDKQDVWLISAEDVVAFKSIAHREERMEDINGVGVKLDAGKFDLTDIQNILFSTKINQKAVQERLKSCGFLKQV